MFWLRITGVYDFNVLFHKFGPGEKLNFYMTQQ